MGNRIGSGWSNNTNAFLDGKIPSGENRMRWNSVGADFFTTLGVPVREGRDFRGSDSQAAPKVAIVNETFVKRFLKGREAMGHIASYTPELAFTIVGVVADSKYTGVREDSIPMAYFPYPQVGLIGDMHLELRTAGDPAAFLPVVRKAVASLAPDLALLQPMSQRAQFAASITQDVLVSRLSQFFSALAILPVASGLYGTLAYSVSRRTSEFGTAASAWLASKIDELRGKVADADAKAENYRAQSGLLAGSNNMTVPGQQLVDLNTQLAAARSAQSAALAKAQLLRGMLRDGRFNDVPELAKDESLRRYAEQRVALKEQIAQESRTLLPGHPRMKELAAQLAGLDSEIRIAVDKAARGLENDARLAAAQVDTPKQDDRGPVQLRFRPESSAKIKKTLGPERTP